MHRDPPEEKILSAALEVVSRETINGTRMHLIAQEAGVGQSNLHYYFRTKQQLLVALLDYVQEHFSDKRAQVLAQMPDTLEGQLAGFFEQKRQIILHEEKYDRIQIDFWCLGEVDAEINERFCVSYEIWRRHIGAVVERFLPELPEAARRSACYAAVSLMMGASIQAAGSPLGSDLDRYFAFCMEMLLEALGEKTQKGSGGR